MKWLFVDKLAAQDAVIDGAEFQHIKALRIKVGDTVRLFDGRGVFSDAVVKQLDRRQAVLTVPFINQANRVKKPRLFFGVTKFPALEVVLQKATEVGVDEIILLSVEHTPIRFSEAVFNDKKDRWLKIMQSACEQSKQLFVPKLTYQLYHQAIDERSDQCMLHPTADQVLRVSNFSCSTDVFIGPEGGWSDDEVSAFTGQILKIEGSILRADTACIAALMACQIS